MLILNLQPIWILLVPAILFQPQLTKAENDSKRTEHLDQPNIIIIIADDMGYNDIGYNNPKVRTPVLDKLAKEGRILTQNYAQPWSIPSRQALMTGRYPWKTLQGEYRLTAPECVPVNIKLLPQVLKDIGYKTHMVGKWHLGFCQEKCLPTRRGFDTFYGMYMGMGDFYNHTDCTRYHLYDWHRGDRSDKTAIGQHTTKLITNEAVKILKDHNPDDGPFFLYMAHSAPHVPLQVEQKYIDLYADEPEGKRRIYLGMVTDMDEQIGKVIETLERRHLRNNTVIVFSAASGGDVIKAYGDNSPYRGSKQSLWEGGSRVIGFVNAEMLQKKGTIHDGLFSSIDWFPTLVNLAKGNTYGLDPDGLDQTRMILDGGDSRRTEVIYTIDMSPFPRVGNAAIRIGDYKLIWGFEGLIDGYGRENYFSWDPRWETLTPPSDRFSFVQDILQPYAVYLSKEFTRGEAQAIRESRIDPNNINSGNVHLYYLLDDPQERNDLAKISRFRSKVMEMKRRILKLARYWRPVVHVPEREAAALRAAVNGTWTTGFCEDLKIES